MTAHLVRIGFAGDCFVAVSLVESATFTRGSEVLVQTPRGIELGEVLGEVSVNNAGSGDTQSGDMQSGNAGSEEEDAPTARLRIIRSLTEEDRLLVERLQRYKRDAVRRCQDVLASSDSDAVLLDVDQLFDGNTLVLHFLGPVDALGREITDQIVAEYEARVQSIRLAELMTHGCGPDCGTEAGGGCGTGGGCASCAVAGACTK
ncbi:cell fate regulator YaaT (PSP1 superfamily) [Rhodopirellula rubra]|uniref:Cell fate regulator YaaT (PSP1 superfamily) n=1 Tax=Aporhodopirellula rubra TaxID=980271 RepID=A0A7W5DWM1_9BACT|nr:PSP1 C-terminal domain-containing protein [Aporhodopirellula rubra]MBB3205906.1 cell fate regulator YaaT (PSP1 superfamily) [Aporhodopirellula rubra]